MVLDIGKIDAILFTYFWTNVNNIRAFLEQNNEKAVFSDDIDIAPLLNLEYAYNPNPLRATFFSVTENTCIMFPKLQDGWSSLSSYITNGLKIKSYYFRIMDDKKILMPSNYLTCNDGLGGRRTVYAQKENRWVFANVGEPLPFENTEYYSEKQIKARLNKDILLEYCEKLNITLNGKIDLNESIAFTYESYWEGEFAGSKGRGATSLARKN